MEMFKSEKHKYNLKLKYSSIDEIPAKKNLLGWGAIYDKNNIYIQFDLDCSRPFEIKIDGKEPESFSKCNYYGRELEDLDPDEMNPEVAGEYCYFILDKEEEQYLLSIINEREGRTEN